MITSSNITLTFKVSRGQNKKFEDMLRINAWGQGRGQFFLRGLNVTDINCICTRSVEHTGRQFGGHGGTRADVGEDSDDRTDVQLSDVVRRAADVDDYYDGTTDLLKRLQSAQMAKRRFCRHNYVYNPVSGRCQASLQVRPPSHALYFCQFLPVYCRPIGLRCIDCNSTGRLVKINQSINECTSEQVDPHT